MALAAVVEIVIAHGCTVRMLLPRPGAVPVSAVLAFNQTLHACLVSSLVPCILTRSRQPACPRQHYTLPTCRPSLFAHTLCSYLVHFAHTLFILCSITGPVPAHPLERDLL